MTEYNKKRLFKVQGAVQQANTVFDTSKTASNVIDIKASNYDLTLKNKNLLKQYSKEYNISDNLDDYMFIPVPIFITNIPNKNGIAFTDDQMDTFYSDIGQYTYQTWIGKPCFVEHEDSDKTQSLGLIFDASLRPLDGYSIPLRQCWVLWGLDRTKNVDITRQIQSKKHNYFSMGAQASTFECSTCKKQFIRKSGLGYQPACNHMPDWPRMNTTGNVLHCANAIEIVGTEVSYVADPAWVSAEASQILEIK